MEIVSTLQQSLVDRVGKKRFELWFGGSTHLRFDGCALTVGVPNRFLLDWIRSNFREALTGACEDVLGHVPPLHFCVEDTPPESAAEEATVVAGSNATPTAMPRADSPSDSSSTGSVGVVKLGASAIGAARGENGRESSRRKFAKFDSFVSGDGNALGLASARMVARQPGKLTPLLLYGPTGVGKTHLLEGIWCEARRSQRRLSTVFLSAEQFTSYFLEALRGSGLPSFRRKYRGVDLLIIDDLQFLAGKRATQVELLHTVDTLMREGRQLVFAADRPPNALADLGPELTTRLQSGMVCQIEPADYATRLGIIRQMSERLGVKVPEDVQQYIANGLANHARELSGALCRLQATSEALGTPVTLAMAKQSLAEMIRQCSRVVRLGDIERAVCDVFGLDPSGLQSGRKAKQISYPRMLAMWLARKHTRAALSEIGQYFGRRSHSTVVSAQRRVDDWRAHGTTLKLPEGNWEIDEAIRRVEQQLQAG